jgi:hypothetical protein
MPTAFTETLLAWHDFYFMIGGAAAALLGLMFVALSLGTHLINDTTRETIDTFTTPNIVYFVSVMLISAVMLVPAYSMPLFRIMILGGAVLDITIGLYHVRKLYQAGMKHGDFNREDWLWTTIMPLISFALLLSAAISFALSQWSIAFALLPFATIAILITAIANTWGVVIWIIYVQKK